MDAIEAYITKHEKYTEKLFALRELFLKTKLEESVKWGIPNYSLNGKNVAGLAAFNKHCTIWFYQGVFLKDKHKQLINAQEGKTQAQRQWRFAPDDQLNTPLILTYIKEAIQNEENGKRIKPKKKPLLIPLELKDRLKETGLNTQFETLKLTKKRLFCEYISEAKRDATKVSRLDKIIPMIKAGIGLHDNYKNC